MYCLISAKNLMQRSVKLCAATFALAHPHAVQSHGVPLAAAMPSAAIWVAIASTNSQCITLIYDKNGNRVSQTVGNIAMSTTAWGSGTYGCFVWKP